MKKKIDYKPFYEQLKKKRDENPYIGTLKIFTPIHRLYLSGIIASSVAIIIAFILLFATFDPDKVWPAFYSSLISVLGGVLASFVVAYIIDAVQCRKHNSSLQDAANDAAYDIAAHLDAFNTLLISDVIAAPADLQDSINVYPFQNYVPDDGHGIVINVVLAEIVSSLGRLLSIDDESGHVILGDRRKAIKNAYLGFESLWIDFVAETTPNVRKVGRLVRYLRIDEYFKRFFKDDINKSKTT